MSDVAKNFLDKLFVLSQEPECKVAIVCGAPGAGKSEISRALEGVSELGAVHVSIDNWIFKSTQDRARDLAEARRCNDFLLIAHLSNLRNQINWPKFFHDFYILQKTGFLELHGVYQHKTGELVDDVTLIVPPKPPHLILL